MGSSNQSNNGQQPRLGITEPISLGGPTEYDVVKTNELEKDANLYESREGAVEREEVLGRLDQIVKSWVKTISRAKGLNEQLVQEANAKIFTFGSYRLGVHGPGADIDTLCVGPRHATREENFFGDLYRMLSEMPEVAELHPVPDAHVPVMKFKFNGVSIDLLYARLSLWVIPDIERHSSNMLQCHPHPRDFSDKSKPLYCFYFFGLQRKQGIPVNEGEPFDMRGTSYEFKLAVYQYSAMKDGMEINVTHVKRKEIPSFVFPGGVRPSRRSKPTWDSKKAAEQKVPLRGGVEHKSPEISDGLDDVRKRKRVDNIPDAGDDCHKIARNVADMKKIETFVVGPSQNSEINGIQLAENFEMPSYKEEEKLAIDKIMSDPYPTSQTPLQELEELEDIEFGTQVTDNDGVILKSNLMEFHEAASLPVSSDSGPNPSTPLHLNGRSEDLEPLELSVPIPNAMPAAPVAQKKPLIKLSFTTIKNTGGKSG
ncbi:hypothetical protein ACFE04_007102 [Oxalis oulophora]